MYFEYQMIFCHISGIGRSRANFPEVVGMFANEWLHGSVRLVKFVRTWDYMQISLGILHIEKVETRKSRLLESFMQMCEKSAELDLRESYVLKYRVFKLFQASKCSKNVIFMLNPFWNTKSNFSAIRLK